MVGQGDPKPMRDAMDGGVQLTEEGFCGCCCF